MSKKTGLWLIVLVVLLLAIPVSSFVQARGGLLASLADVVPMVISYQGQVHINGAPYVGTGYFKFAVINASGTVSYWSNDGSSTAGSQPTMGVPLGVNEGLFSVLLGDVTQVGMTQPLSAAVFSAPDRYLRVWFSSNGVTYQQLLPDRRFVAVPYALHAQDAVNAEMSLAADTAGYAVSAGTAITATNAMHASDALYATDTDMLDGFHASEIGGLPSGSMVLGIPNDTRLINEGLMNKGLTYLSYGGTWADINSTGMPGARRDRSKIGKELAKR